VRGRIDLPPTRVFELAKENASGPVWQNVDPARFSAATGVAALPVMIEATAAPTPGDGLVLDWPAPDFGVDKHRIYMVQWYSFAALAIVLWIVLNLRRAKPPSHA
jgi:surfeit locus 1 family protein